MAQEKHPIHQLTLLRHGQSLANKNQILQGQLDSSLSEAGIQQSHSLAKLWELERVVFDLVISSPLQRARKTAEIISERLDLTIELIDGWMERKFGVAEGKPYEELQTLLQGRSSRSPYDPAFDDAESDWDLFIRASSSIQDILGREPGRYLVVSHGGMLNSALQSILGIPPAPSGARSILRLENTGYAITEYSRLSESWIISVVNDTRHLVRKFDESQ